MAKDKALTVTDSMEDFKAAYAEKRKLIERELEDFKFALGDQWSKEDTETLRKANMKPITDNRIAPNIFLLTGLERQNRSDFKAFPVGEEDTLKAEVTTRLFKDAIIKSEFPYKSSDQFKDGVMCGESHLELYLDYTDNLLNGCPYWRKLDGNVLFPEPGFKEYDFKDCRYVYKVLIDVSQGDLINLYPEKKKLIEAIESSRLDMESITSDGSTHTQMRNYPKPGMDAGSDTSEKDDGFDLIERYYKKWVETFFVGDKQTGKIELAENKDKAQGFIDQYKAKIVSDQQAYQGAIQQALAAHMQEMSSTQMMDANGMPMAPVDPSTIPMDQHLQMMNQQGALPPEPPPQNPDRFILIKRMVPEIWCFAHTPAIEEPLADARAWFYPKWKSYPFVSYFARFSSAPLKGDDRHLLVQGLVHGVKGAQEKHNKAEMLMLKHLNTSANSGWLSEEDAWVDDKKVEQFGTVAGVNLQYKKGFQKPERITPTPLSVAHAQIAADSSESIKAQLGINADLLASQEGGGDSGRAIALRQRQGLLMVQELYDNLTRSRVIAGRFLLSQLGEIYDTETAKQVLGEAFLTQNFPPVMVFDETGAVDPATGQPKQVPMPDPKTGQPMQYDSQMADLLIAEVLSGELGKYNVVVGESVASETQKMANEQSVKEIATAYPGLIPPDILIEESQLPQATKQRILGAVKQAQALQQEALANAKPPQKKPVGAAGGA